MPCSQCGQTGHNIATCKNWICAIDTRVFIDGRFEHKQVKRPPVKATRQIDTSRSHLKVTLYHGTSLKCAKNIQKNGFVVDKVRSGRMLGNGVYLSPTIGKAFMYAEGLRRPNENGGIVLIVEVDLGKCLTIDTSNIDGRLEWHSKGYDSCYLSGGEWGCPKTADQKYDEYCIANGSRVHIVGMVFGDTMKAMQNGYTITENRLHKKSKTKT